MFTQFVCAYGVYGCTYSCAHVRIFETKVKKSNEIAKFGLRKYWRIGVTLIIESR